MKKSYSTWSNILFSHRYILGGHAAEYCGQSILIIAGNLLTAFMQMYLSAYAVELFTRGISPLYLLEKLILYIGILYIVTVITKRLEREADKRADNERIRKGKDYYGVLCSLEYEQTECASFKTMYKAGQISYYDGFHSGFSHIIRDFRTTILSITGLIIYSIMIAKVDVRITVIMLLLSSVSLWMSSLHKKWITENQASWEKLDVKTDYLSRESIALKNAKDINLYPVKSWFLQKWDALVAQRRVWKKRELNRIFGLNCINRILEAVKYVIVYLLVVRQVQNGLPVSEFVLTVSLTLGMNSWITKIFENVRYLSLNSVNIQNTRKVLDMCEDQPDNAVIQRGKQCSAPEIRLENVSFTFPETEKPIMQHFNLTIHAGENLALVGNNGAGKSTLVKLICGLYRPSAGKIYINGVDTAALSSGEIYEQCSVVFQDFQLLAASLAENVSCLPYEETDCRRVEMCLEQAGLKEKFKALPDGMKTELTRELDAGGILLSGGEIQKLMIARCLYRDRKLLILDEPTAALDAIAESKIYLEYEKLADRKTSIFVSHRLSSTKFCDRIVLLDRGSIAEQGTFDELMERNGEFARLYRLQLSYYAEQREV